MNSSKTKKPKKVVDPAVAIEKRLRLYFNISPEEKALVLDFQHGNCAVKQEPSKLLVIDHDHKTGLVRGLIDWKINQALQGFSDSPELLRRAADYLENPTVTQALGEPVYGVMGRISNKAAGRRYGPAKTKTPQPRNNTVTRAPNPTPTLRKTKEN